MRLSKLWLGLLALPLCGFALAGQPQVPQPPRLLVLISVDQLRGDLLLRYDRYFTGGFRRLLDQGAVYTAVHDHAGSETAPGHATLSTGVFPSHSGIVANDWSERAGDGWKSVYNVEDAASPILGFPKQQGMSPANLMHTGVADWVRAADPRAKVVSISGKDRSAILMAGKAKGQVFWYETGLGRFITSGYYAQDYPQWVERFNTRVLPTLLDSAWTEQSPAAARALARPDTAAYEGDGVHTYFPHRFRDEAGNGSFLGWVANTPVVDRAVLKLIEQAIPATGLGQDDVTDFLAVGLSQTDRVGHRYGPLSREQLDNLIRLDRELGEFFRYLDRTVGRGRWVAALSADHGSTTMPEWQAAHGQPGQRLTAAERRQLADAAKQAAEGAAPGQAPAAVVKAVRQLPFVADAYTHEELARGAPRDSFVALYRRSYHPARIGSDLGKYGVEVRLKEGTYSGGATGTGHGTSYFYDRMVPLIFLGDGIVPVRLPQLLARTVDLAPTLARLGGITPPGDLDGVALPVQTR